MTTTAKGSQNSTQKELLEAGSYVARCYSVIDLGTHQNEKFLNPKTQLPQEQRKIRLTFELPDELRVFDEAKGEQPMVLGKKYTLSLSEKAYLRKDLESRRGKSFNEEEMNGFELSNLVGVPCILSIGLDEYDGKQFNQINGISPLMKGQKVLDQVNPSVKFDLDNFKIEEFNELPKFIRKDISNSVEGCKHEYDEEFKMTHKHETKEEKTETILDPEMPF